MIRKMGSFRSYVGLEEYEMKHAPKSQENSLQPDFLNGELIIHEALNVLKFTSLSKRKGLSGSLFVTNARVVFVTSDNQTLEDSVPLLSINILLYYENPKGSNAKKHRRVVKLGPSSINNPNLIPSGSTRVHELLIACSNFTTSRFSFKFSPIDHGLRICNAIIHHAFPMQLERLFYFDYSKVTSSNWRQSVSQSTINIPSYLEKGTWLKEINITRCNNGYRISSVNENFQLCGSLPEWIVVPADLNDERLKNLSEKLKGGRPPHWSWGDSKGAGILRMGKLHSENESSAENAFFELLRKTHPKRRPPQIVDLDKEVPAKEIKLAFNKLFELCCPETHTHFHEIDNRFYSHLDQTRWMHWISKAIQIVQASVDKLITNQDIIIIQETEGRDTACFISSLIQVAIDARFRSVVGFFSLIQKEWIAFGHPFHSSYMHASPVFLIFLDSVHQLMKQNIVEFEFNDKLLIHVWDSCFDATRGTFLFDTPQQRRTMDRWNEYTAWDLILASDQQERHETINNQKPDQSPSSNLSNSSKSSTSPSSGAFLPVPLINPMHKLKTLLFPPKPSNYLISSVLNCSNFMCDLDLWRDMYINRTLNGFGPLGSLTVSQPLITNNEEIPPNKTTVSPARSTPQSTDSESSFIYPPTVTSTRIGRNPSVEMKVVDILLATLTSSTRYNRNSHATSSSSSSSSIIGLSSNSNSVFREKTSNAPAVPTKPDALKRRKNPFTHM